MFRALRRPGRARVRLLALAAATAPLAAAAPLVATGPATADASYAPGTGRPFAATSAWNDPIGTNVRTDANSARWVDHIASSGSQATLLNRVTIYDADANTPKVRVNCVNTDWGPCLDNQLVPIPANAVPAGPIDNLTPDDDNGMEVIDWSTGKHYDFWRVRKNANGGWTCDYCSVGSISSDGRDTATVGAGVSRLAGVIRASEIAQGRIDHALVFASNFSAASFRYPATKSDGSNMVGAPLPMPEGARIQLDPSVNCDALPGASRGEVTICKALQTYGAYNIDNGGYHALGFDFEMPHPGQASPYEAAGLEDWGGMPHLPWNRLRVLSAWNSYTPVAATPAPTSKPAPARLTAPAGVRVTGVTFARVSVAWNAASGPVAGYRVWRGDANWDNWQMVGQVGAGARSFTDRTVYGRTGYTYAVRVFDKAGHVSNSSNVVQVTTK